MSLLPVALALFVLMAPGGVAWAVAQQTLLQQAVSDRYRGRIFATAGTAQTLLFLCGQGIGSALGGVIGVVGIWNLAAGLSLLSALAFMLLKPANQVF